MAIEDLDQIAIASSFCVHLLQNAFDQGIKMIGSIREEYKDIFIKTPLHRRIQYIHLEEPDETKTYEILKGMKPFLEKHHHIQILDEAIRFCIQYAGKMAGKNPVKAIHLIDLACSRARFTESSKLGSDDIMAALSFMGSFA